MLIESAQHSNDLLLMILCRYQLSLGPNAMYTFNDYALCLLQVHIHLQSYSPILGKPFLEDYFYFQWLTALLSGSKDLPLCKDIWISFKRWLMWRGDIRGNINSTGFRIRMVSYWSAYHLFRIVSVHYTGLHSNLSVDWRHLMYG